MDETVKTVLIDESAPVSEVVDTVCKRIGIANPEEYSLQKDTGEDEKMDRNASIRRKQGSKENLSSEESI
jgi:talin